MVPANVAMTGEITLRGRVTPVGGIKEKVSSPSSLQPEQSLNTQMNIFVVLQVLGAHRANITKVILPQANRKDVEHDVPREVREALDLVFVRTIEEALDAAFGKGALMWRRGSRGGGSMLVESRL